jgi:phenylacetate-coenzyme A ligase PaaK-like adenylate-forming protein
MGNKLKFIKRVICTGEPILEAHRKAVREAWDAEIFGTYGTEEFDGVAYECEAHQGYHIVDDDLIVEIADPDLRVPTGGKTGLLVMSKINRTGTVLLRYPVGDIAEVNEAPCRCGSGSPRIILLGRVSETLFLYNGLKITINAVEEAIKSALGTLPLYQLVVQGEKDKESLVLIVQHAPSEETRGRILRSILSSLPDLEEAYTMDKSVDLRVILDSSFSSFFITRRGKLPRVVDRRQKS